MPLSNLHFPFIAAIAFTITFQLITSHGLRAQHDPGRDAMRLIAKGDFVDARKRLAKPPRSQNSPINDAERHYVLAIVDCKQGNPASAIEHLRTALRLGLPIERILAGPRDLFMPLQQDASFKLLLDQTPKPLLHGPMLTSLTDTSAQFWVRTKEVAKVTVTLAKRDGNKESGHTGSANTSKNADYTGVVVVKGLDPSTEYVVKISVDGQVQSHASSFKTFPKIGAPSRMTIGFGGGAGYTPQFHHMWSTVQQESLTAFLTLGDNVYIDDPEHPITQRYCYYRRQSEPLWKSFISKTPIYSIYDDHDFGMNDCIPGPEIDVPAWKRPVWEVFSQNWNNPGFGGGHANPGCWYQFQIGDVQFIMLDGRYYRDRKGGSMIGPIQKKWLFETIAKSDATFKFLVSPVPWSPGVKPGSKDTWDGFAEEREQIFSFVHANKIDGVVLMAADRHRSDLRRIPRGDGYDFYEMMSSRLTNVHTHGLVKNAKGSVFVMGYNEKCSFGRVAIDTATPDPVLDYTIVNIDGEEVGKARIKLSEMKHP